MEKTRKNTSTSAFPKTIASLVALDGHINNHTASASFLSGKEILTDEEEKRKRNTAASARFRIKKMQKEEFMEKTVQHMTTTSEGLEKRVLELELEIKHLKSLLLVKKDPPSTIETQPLS